MVVFNVRNLDAQPLKIKRKLANMPQTLLGSLSNVLQSRISHFENGQINLNDAEKEKIEKILGSIVWDNEVLNGNVDEFSMPREDVGEPVKGLMIRRTKNGGLDDPVLIWAGTPKDHTKYTYEKIKDWRNKND